MRPRSTKNDLQRLLDEVDRFDTAMLVTLAADGEFHARPMVISDIAESGELWFATNEGTRMIAEADKDQRGLALMQADGMFVSVSGHLRHETNTRLVRAHLSADAEHWLQDDLGSPAALVLAPLTAEFWDCHLDESRPGRRHPSATRLVEHVRVPFAAAPYAHS